MPTAEIQSQHQTHLTPHLLREAVHKSGDEYSGLTPKAASALEGILGDQISPGDAQRLMTIVTEAMLNAQKIKDPNQDAFKPKRLH